jgi:uncharacterized membrane protein YgdD (TMEM256/DUF423 family)
MKGGTIRKVAAGMALAGVVLGAFGAHKLEPLLMERDLVGTWETAVFYHLVHAVALWARPKTGWFAWLLMGGVGAFSGSLYVYTLTLWKPLVWVTPIGGLLLVLAWVSVLCERDGEES